MHARMSTIYGAAEQGGNVIHMFREQVLSAVKELGGKGAVLLVDRSSGKAVSITLWEDEDAMRQSEERANELRRQASESAGASEAAKVDRFEVAVWEV
jgi:formylmethanofuran dehydrogenase subunit E